MINWETTSGGVKTAATIKMPTITYPLLRASVAALTTPSLVRKKRNSGSSKESPKVRSSMQEKESVSLSFGAGTIKSVAKPRKNLKIYGTVIK